VQDRANARQPGETNGIDMHIKALNHFEDLFGYGSPGDDVINADLECVHWFAGLVFLPAQVVAEVCDMAIRMIACSAADVAATGGSPSEKLALVIVRHPIFDVTNVTEDINEAFRSSTLTQAGYKELFQLLYN
jgi:hypothetical protein